MKPNKIYKAINLALDIRKADQVAIFAQVGQRRSSSELDGFWRRPGDNRHRTLYVAVLEAYLRGLECRVDNETAGEIYRLEQALADGQRLSERDLDYWINLAQVRRGFDIRPKL